MRGRGSFQPLEIRKGIKLVGLNISNRMKRNEQVAAKQETLGTFYCMPGLFFGTHLSHAHNSCSPGLAARGSSLPQTLWAHPSLVSALPFPGHRQLWWHSLLLPQLAPDQTCCAHTHPGQRVGFAHNLCAECPVAQFKHRGEYVSTISSFNAAGACWEIKALSWLSGWVKKDLAPTATLVSLHSLATWFGLISFFPASQLLATFPNCD